LDGYSVQQGLCRDLGVTEFDRVENIRRVAEVAGLMLNAGLIVLLALISPFRAERQMTRGFVGEGEFMEIYVDTPNSVAEGRDIEGLYEKARKGQLRDFTGIDSPYEIPEHPEVRIDTTAMSAEQSVMAVLDHLFEKDIIWQS
jgi:bifunctional enzyme CysN/CysC